MAIQFRFLIHIFPSPTKIPPEVKETTLQGNDCSLSPHFSRPVSCLWHCDLPDPYLHSCWLRHWELYSDLAFIISTGSIFVCVPEKFSFITSQLHCGSATGLSSWPTLVHFIHLITRLRNQITWILMPLLYWWHAASVFISTTILSSRKISDWFSSFFFFFFTKQTWSHLLYIKNFSVLDHLNTIT